MSETALHLSQSNVVFPFKQGNLHDKKFDPNQYVTTVLGPVKGTHFVLFFLLPLRLQKSEIPFGA